MKRFVEGTDRGQATLFPECLADWIDENNPVQVIDVFVDELDLAALGVGRAVQQPRMIVWRCSNSDCKNRRRRYDTPATISATE
jgi:hypothetical protein